MENHAIHHCYCYTKSQIYDPPTTLRPGSPPPTQGKHSHKRVSCFIVTLGCFICSFEFLSGGLFNRLRISGVKGYSYFDRFSNLVFQGPGASADNFPRADKILLNIIIFYEIPRKANAPFDPVYGHLCELQRIIYIFKTM